MFIELVDILRCPRDHEDSWLVAAIHQKTDRDIVEGILGCPICRAEYPIHDGVAIFGETPVRGAAPVRAAHDETDDDAAMRCAAMLDLFDPGGAVILGGEWGRAALALLDITPVAILLVDPPPALAIGKGLSAIRIGERLPVAAGSLRGIALDERTSSPVLVEAAVRALKPGGRLVAPAAAIVPEGIAERARDDRHWVGEVNSARSGGLPLTIQRARPR
jgi:uncharacterized protein YbaR (Trm112 family)